MTPSARCPGDDRAVPARAIDAALVDRFRRDAHAASGDRITPDDRLGVAVSGGADSLALLLLAHAAFPGRVRAVSIDHRLRAEAAGECAFVASICAAVGVPHDTLSVTVVDEGEGLQSAGRYARREALGTWCRRRRVPWMMMGHHADDQAETVLMRLARGSGIGGLSGIDAMAGLPFDPASLPHENLYAPASLIRPLLGWRRAELAAVVAAAGLTPVNDPSNRDPRYDRTRFRALLAATDLLNADRIGATARHCADADVALGWTVLMLEQRCLSTAPGQAVLEIAPLRPWHVEIMRRVLLDIFRHFGAWPQPRGAQLLRLLGLLHAGRTATLAGLKATPSDGVWTFTPAPPRRAAGLGTRRDRAR